MSHPNILSVAELASLESSRDQLSFKVILSRYLPVILLPHHLLPHLRDPSVFSRLRTATRFTRPIPRIKQLLSSS